VAKNCLNLNGEHLMRAIKLHAQISAEHTLNLQLPADVPPGMAEVIVLVPVPEPVNKPDDLQAFMEWLDQQPRHIRSKEEIDRYIEE
jgi:hypothetical protein